MFARVLFTSETGATKCASIEPNRRFHFRRGASATCPCSEQVANHSLKLSRAASKESARMLRIALRSLVHEKGKFVAALWGVSFAAGLALAQTGLYVGFRAMATSVISRVGG